MQEFEPKQYGLMAVLKSAKDRLFKWRHDTEENSKKRHANILGLNIEFDAEPFQAPTFGNPNSDLISPSSKVRPFFRPEAVDSIPEVHLSLPELPGYLRAAFEAAETMTAPVPAEKPKVVGIDTGHRYSMERVPDKLAPRPEAVDIGEWRQRHLRRPAA